MSEFKNKHNPIVTKLPTISLDASDFQSGWGLYNAKSKNQKKTTVHNPKQNPEKKSNIKEGTKVLIKTRNNELIIHSLVSDPI